MIGRRQFGIAGVTAAAAATLPAFGFAQQDADPHAAHGHGGAFAKCAAACSDCQRECDACSTHCTMLLAEGKKPHLTTLRSCLDCADICATAAQVSARQGVYAGPVCQACADICARCAKECDKFKDDEMMAACAESCRKCEKACREMLTHVTAT